MLMENSYIFEATSKISPCVSSRAHRNYACDRSAADNLNNGSAHVGVFCGEYLIL